MNDITRRKFSATAAGAAVSSLFPFSVKRKNKPNVLLVIADEWRYQSTGYGGDTNALMPSIDGFAAQSLNFETAISGCSVCCPARASLITGQYPLTHGVYINDVPLKPRGLTLGESFAKEGYSTAYIGKWHLFGSPDGKYGRREAYIPSEYRFGFDYWKVAECTHDYNHSFYYENDDPNRKYWLGYDAEAQTADACGYIRQHARADIPYLLVLSWGPPHYPLDSAPARYAQMFRDRDLTLRRNVPATDREDAVRDLRGYYAHIAALDDCFKRLLATLEATGTVSDTIIVFTSDHGDMMYSQGLQHKTYPWEESIRVPLLVRYPERLGNAGLRSRVPINTPDILPTLLGLSGLPVPKEVQGTDYSKSWSASDSNESAFLCLPASVIDARRCGFAEYRGVRNGRYLYVRSIKGPWLLYDNLRDPYQMKNLCGKSEAKATQNHMESELRTWLETLDDSFLSGSEYLRRDGLAHYLETQFPIGHVNSPWNDWSSVLSKNATLSVDSFISDLMEDARARALLERVLPDSMSGNSKSWPSWAYTVSLRFVHGRRPELISDRQFEELERALVEIAHQSPK